MNILITCPQCGYEHKTTSNRELMNKIVMWNHMKRAHPGTAESILRRFKRVPHDLYHVKITA